MDLNQAGAGNPGRNEAFSQGTTGTPGSVASSLNSDANVLNSQVAADQSTPQSVLQPIMKNPGGLGMSASDKANRTITGSYLGSGDGSSKDTFKQASMLHMLGNSSEMTQE